jgi:hypothetical protein
MCLHKTNSRVCVGKRFSDVLLIKNGWKQGDVLSPLLFNFDLEYAIWRVLAKGLKLNCTHQLPFHADDTGQQHTYYK